MLEFLKNLFGGPKVDFKTLVQNGAVIIDVRTPAEYKAGHIKGSLNFPLDTLKQKVADIKKRQKPVITVCRSGARSSMGRNLLKQNGIEAYNGGSWDGLERKLG